MKEELYINTPEGSREQLDLPSPSGVTLKWVNNLFSDISKLTCSHSYTFKLPQTQRNIRLLDMANDIRHKSKMIRKRVDADFYINGICLCPNANLYVSEVGDKTFSCVMTWRVLKAFETLKSSSMKLNELSSLGTFTWRDDDETLQYGMPTNLLGNDADILYPDYDAGVPHEEGTPPKPVMPVFRLIQMINEQFGVKFDIGRHISQGMGILPAANFNNKNFYGREVYDDYVTYGVVPITGVVPFLSDKYVARNVSLANLSYAVMDGSYQEEGSYRRYTKEDDDKQFWRRWHNWVKSNVSKRHYWGGLATLVGQKSNGEIVKPSWNTFIGSDRFQQKTRETSVSENLVEELNETWSTMTNGVWSGRYRANEVYFAERTMEGYLTYGGTPATEDVVTLKLEAQCEIRGTASIVVKKTAVSAGRLSAPEYWWIYIVEAKKNDKGEITLDTFSDNGEDWIGLRSIRREESEDAYTYYFDFGVDYEARRINISAIEEDSIGYLFWSGYEYTPPEDTHPTFKSIIQSAGFDFNDYDKSKGLIMGYDFYGGDGSYYEENNPDWKKVIYHNNGSIIGVRTPNKTDAFDPDDVRFGFLNLASITPSQEVATKIPVEMDITRNLPPISCFDFMKDIFYMNGALPRVEKDGKTIVAMYYNQLRDRVLSGECVDWSSKILEGKSQASMSKYENTNFGQKNYFEMAYSRREKSEDDKRDELELYGEGYGTVGIADLLLAEEKSLYKANFFPGLRQDIAYPEVITGRTMKVWDGEKHIVTVVNPLYGFLNLRTLDPEYEATNNIQKRPLLKERGVNFKHIRMNAFEPFEDIENLFGYFGKILENFTCVKEKMLLNEFDLRDFNESVPVYLNKYNSFFAVSSIQRDKEGVSTVELIQLPYVKHTYKRPEEVNVDTISYSWDILWSGVTNSSGSWDDRFTMALEMGVTNGSSYYGILVSDNVYYTDGVLVGGKGVSIPSDGNNVNNAWYYQKWVRPQGNSTQNPSGRWDEQPYTLTVNVPSKVRYNIKKMVGFDTEYEKTLQADVKVYYDDTRLPSGSHTFTYTKAEDGQYHVFKIAVDILDNDGNMVHEIRKKIYYFVYTPDLSVINDEWGEENEYVLKVDTVTVTGEIRINSTKARNYQLSYKPTNATVNVSSIQVTANSQNVSISNVSTSGFTLTPVSLPVNEEPVQLNIKVTLEDGSSFDATHTIRLQGVLLSIDGAEETEVVNGKGSSDYKLSISPLVSVSVQSITSSNAAIKVVNISGYSFSLSVDDITEDTMAEITAKVIYDGDELTTTKQVKFTTKEEHATNDKASLDTEGAMIIDVNGMLYTKDAWNAAGILNEDAEGIAISDGTHRFIIAKKSVNVKIGGVRETGMTWYDWGAVLNYEGTLVNGQFTTESDAQALTDFNGKTNTDAIIASLSDTTVGQIRDGKQFPSGAAAYLGTVGQWNIINGKLTLINELLNIIDGEVIGKDTYQETSTQYDKMDEWYIAQSKGLQHHRKNGVNPTRAICDFRELPQVSFASLIVNGADAIKGVSGTTKTIDFALSTSPTGAAITEVAVESNNSHATISNVTSYGFKVTANIVNNYSVKLKISARVNGLKKIVERELKVFIEGDAVIDFAKLDEAKALIADTELNLYTEDEWSASGKTNSQAEGVAFSDGEHRFIIAKRQYYGNYWSKYFGGTGVKIEGLEYGKTLNGYDNTQKIIASIIESDGYYTEEPYSAAAFVALAEAFPSGKKGYLPAALEFEAISNSQELTLVDNLMKIIGGNQLISSGISSYWTSDIMYDENYADKFAYEWCQMYDRGWITGAQRNSKNAIIIFRKLEK